MIDQKGPYDSHVTEGGLIINSPIKKVLVLGGKGFIGRHAVNALKQHNVNVVIGSRNPSQSAEVGVQFETLLDSVDWVSVIQGFDVVLNCVGILRPVGKATYDSVHHRAPAALAEACQTAGIRFVHVSALGLNDDAKSGFLVSKLQGERAIQAIAPNSILVRPSLLDGEGGYGASWLRGVARLPLFVVPADANGIIAGLFVSELGEALATLCLKSDEELALNQTREFELGGRDAVAFEAYIRGLRQRYSNKQAICIKVPGIAARLGAHICDLFHATPFSFGHWELLRNDNKPEVNRLAELIGREPAALFEAAVHDKS